MSAPGLLRPGLLDGSRVVLAHSGRGEHGAAAAEACARLGAEVAELAVDPAGEAPEAARGDVLVWDGAGAFGGRAGIDAVRAALDGAWLAIRAAASRDGGKIVLLAPPAGDEHAAAARAGLENLARTLSIEWSASGARVVCVLAGDADDVGQVTAYLASRAGDYFSGTAIELR